MSDNAIEVEWGAFSRWSFGSNFTWGSIETITIGRALFLLRRKRVLFEILPKQRFLRDFLRIATFG